MTLIGQIQHIVIKGNEDRTFIDTGMLILRWDSHGWPIDPNHPRPVAPAPGRARGLGIDQAR